MIEIKLSNGKTPDLFSAADAMKFDYKAERAKHVKIEDGCIVLIEHNYAVELNRCRNKSAILQWVHHLSEKAWVTADLLCYFIELASEYHKINIYEPDY